MTVSRRAQQAGVCVIRFEPEPDRLLVSVSVIWPLDDDNRPTGRERVRHFSDPEQAIAAVAEQLRQIFGRSPRNPSNRVSDRRLTAPWISSSARPQKDHNVIEDRDGQT